MDTSWIDNLKAIQDAERTRVAKEEAAAKASREAADAQEVADLTASHQAQTEALSQYNTAQYNNLSQIVGDIQNKIGVANTKDAEAQKKENAYRYISGLGDTISSLANLVGTTHGAANQQQTYNSHAVVQKAEEARKARKLEMDDLSKRQDEMKTRLRDLKASGSLKEAELAAANAKEMAELTKTHRTAAETEKKYYYNKSEDAVEDASRNFFKQRELDIEANKPGSGTKPKIIKIMREDGSMMDFDVSMFKDFEADYQRAFAAAIEDGESGLTDDEIKAYQKAAKLAAADSNRALNEFFRTHTPRETILRRMGVNNPRYR